MSINRNDSPFHAGEQEIQERLGIREQVEDVGRRFIRSFMPDQHREFFNTLPFMVIGSVDEQAWPWASIVSGRPGFAHSPVPTKLTINTPIGALDPLSDVIEKNAKLGLLGIEPATRRRNRMNAYIDDASDGKMTLTVDQSFGNCPKYIHTRDLTFIREPGTFSDNTKKTLLTELDDTARQLIQASDTFFVSSYMYEPDELEFGEKVIQGVDASHRGGKPGFIKLEDNSLTIPDYYGNNLFNTLGNFLKNPKAGLTFTDFTTGDVLMLTGTVDIIWEGDASVDNYKGAERAWTFHLDHGFWLTDFLPFRAPIKEYSPFLEGLGEWQKKSNPSPNTKNNIWQTYQIERIEQESTVVKSFYLKPIEKQLLPSFKAGQFLPIRLHSKYSLKQSSEKPQTRTYTLSSAPHDEMFRISVKREEHGTVSQWLHDEYKVGDTIEAQKPTGDFFIDTAETRPAVLLAGGIGITPILSMADAINHHNFNLNLNLNYSIETKRELTIFHASRSVEERAFYNHLTQLAKHSKGAIRYIPSLSKTDNNETHPKSIDHIGHIDAKLLKQHLNLDDYDFYLCGPAGFMQACYDALVSLGVNDNRVYAEAFGPAELARNISENDELKTPLEEAETTSIQFMRSSKTHEWKSGDPTILEFAEQHNIDAEFSCRNGSCGSCATKLISGEVVYKNTPTAPYKDNEILICCAVPKKDTDPIKLSL